MRIEGELVKAKFVKRLNRFVALVEVDGYRNLPMFRIRED